MKSKRNAASWLIAIVALCISYPSFSHDSSKPDEPYHQTDLNELHAIVDSIRENSGPEQQAEIDKLTAAIGPELHHLSERANTARRRKNELLLQEVIDKHALREAQENELKAAADLSKKTDAALVSLARIMTPDQRARFREHVAQRHN